VGLVQRQIIVAEFQAPAIDAISFAHRRAASAWRKVSIPAIHQVVPVLNELILAANAAAAVRLIDASRDLGPVAGQTAHLLAIPGARLFRILRRRLQTLAGLNAIGAQLDALHTGQPGGDPLHALRVCHAVGVTTRVGHPLRFRGRAAIQCDQ